MIQVLELPQSICADPNSGVVITFDPTTDHEKATHFAQDNEIDLPFSLCVAHPKRQIEFLMGRTGAMIVQKKMGYMGNPGKETHFSKIWPPELRGSISHTEGFAIAVANDGSTTKALGIDIEGLFSKEQAHKLAPRIAKESEWRSTCQIMGVGEESQAIAVIFSAKESLYKALFSIPMGQARFKSWKDYELVWDSEDTFHFKNSLYSDTPTWDGRWALFGEKIITQVTLKQGDKS